MFHRRLGLAACVFALITADLAAGAGEPSQDEPGIAFSCLYWEGKPEEELLYQHGKSMVPLEFTGASRSRVFELPGKASFELFRHDTEVAEGKPSFKHLASAAVPRGTKKVLFLIIPFEGAAGMNYRIVAIDDSLKAFPRGSFHFTNFTSDPLVAKFDGQTKDIPSGKAVVMSPKPRPDGGFVPFEINNRRGESLYGTRLFGQPHGRELVFITPPLKKGGSPRVKFVSQLLPPPQP